MSTLKAKYGTYEEENLGYDITITCGSSTNPDHNYNITKKWNVITTVLDNHGVCHLPPSKIGMTFFIKNNASNKIYTDIYPFPGESINNNINVPIQLNWAGAVAFTCIDGGDWKTF